RTTILRGPARLASSNIWGTCVVLPEPVGATRTRRLPVRRAATMESWICQMGRDFCTEESGCLWSAPGDGVEGQRSREAPTSRHQDAKLAPAGEFTRLLIAVHGMDSGTLA